MFRGAVVKMPGYPFELVAAHDYETLMGALKERKLHLRLTNLEIDDLGGLPGGYAGKLFSGARCLGLKSLGKMLAALEVRLIVTPAELAQSKLPENAVAFASIAVNGKLSLRSRIARKGGIARASLLTKAKRVKIAQMGGIASGKARRRKGVALAAGPREKGTSVSSKGD